jgi:hypothetical protein
VQNKVGVFCFSSVLLTLDKFVREAGNKPTVSVRINSLFGASQKFAADGVEGGEQFVFFKDIGFYKTVHERRLAAFV